MEEDNNTKKAEKKGDPLLEDIIFPDIEPGIINRKMIEDSYLNEGYKGEKLRLHQLEPVVLERIKVMRLEFKNILRIDHLWILPNLTKLCLNCNKIEVIENIEMLTALTELNLSFNYIEKIQNLSTLVNLEILSLFSNQIEVIENLDSLSKLTILSLGNNKIDSIEGIKRFRFLTNLKVLNLEGNPIARKPDFNLAQYVMAILPKVDYYEYIFIKEEAREEAQEKFYRELREIENDQEKEIQAIELAAREQAEAERLSSSFVEHLDGNQLYESLWRGDEDGRILMLVGGPALELEEEYAKDVFEITQAIYKLGLDRFGERDEEVKDFMSNLKDGQEELQAMGQQLITDFLDHKEKVFEEARKILLVLQSNLIEGDDENTAQNIQLSAKIENINSDFDDLLNELWQSLMAQELHLHEAVEESTTNFNRKISELMGKFVEQAQSFFVQLREVSVHFSENMTEIITRYISLKTAEQDPEDVPPELRICMEDRDAIVNLVAGMKDSHTFRIDEREDRMATRSKEFIDTMIEKLNNDEIERHRAKILEINSFVELMANALAALPEEIHDELMQED